jgi:GT2 family glycosyltransferase
MTAASPKVVISILNWNGCDKTLACLETLRGLDYPDYEMVVVDNHSRDDSVTRIRAAFPDVELLCADANLGFSGGHQFALDHILPRGADLFWMLNNDTRVQPDTLAALVDAYRRWGDALYGSVWLDADDRQRVEFGGGWELDARGQPDFSLYNRFVGMLYEKYRANQPERAVATLSGSSLLVPLSVIRQHGFFDESFFFYGEDIDYCLRLAKKGIPSVIVPTSVITHEKHGAFEGRSKLDWVRTYYYKRNYTVVIRRHRGWRPFLRLVFSDLRFCARAWISSVRRTRKLGIPAKHRDRYLSLRDVLLCRMGKTIAPEDYLD